MILRLVVALVFSLLIVGCAAPTETPLVAETSPPTSSTSTATLSAVEMGATNHSATRTAVGPTSTARAETAAAQQAAERATATAIAEQIDNLLPDVSIPTAWPIEPFSEEQVAAVQDCPIDARLEERYPESLSIDELLFAHLPESDCDWAILAAAFGYRIGEGEFTERAKQVYSEAFARNPSFILSNSMLFSYFGGLDLVEVPSFASQPITHVNIQYTYGGIGDTVDYTVSITQANDNASANGTVTRDNTFAEDYTGPVTYSVSSPLDSNLVQALGPALTDLVPIEQQFEMLVCYDNYPDWTVTLTFEDGSTVDMVTNASNFLYIGGPWQTTIDGQDYVQVSYDFLEALMGVVEALELPTGETAAMNCGDNPEILDLAFPDRQR